MILIIATLLSAASLVLILLDAQPPAVQILSFVAGASLFVIVLMREFPKPDKIYTWIAKKHAIFILIPFLLVLNIVSKKYEHVWDVSELKLFALRSETIEFVKKINDPVRIIIFLRSDDKTVPYAQWLKDQLSKYTPNIVIEIKNINKEILLTRNYDVKKSGETVLVTGSNWVKVAGFREELILYGLMRVLYRQDAAICFMTGHGEPQVVDESDDGISSLKELLDSLGYKTGFVSFLGDNARTIHEKCGAVVDICPKGRFIPAEERLFGELADSDIPLFIAVNPPTPAELELVLEKSGVSFLDKIIVDENNLGRKQPLTDLIMTQLAGHPINEDIGEYIYMPETQSISAVNDHDVAWNVLIETPLDKAIHYMGEDTGKERLVLAVVGEKGGSRKFVLFGSGKPFLNENISFGGNKQIFLNSVRWLLNEENIELVKGRQQAETSISITERGLEWAKRFSFYFFPGAMFLTTLIILGVHRKS